MNYKTITTDVEGGPIESVVYDSRVAGLISTTDEKQTFLKKHFISSYKEYKYQ